MAICRSISTLSINSSHSCQCRQRNNVCDVILRNMMTCQPPNGYGNFDSTYSTFQSAQLDFVNLTHFHHHSPIRRSGPNGIRRRNVIIRSASSNDYSKSTLIVIASISRSYWNTRRSSNSMLQSGLSLSSLRRFRFWLFAFRWFLFPLHRVPQIE